MFKPGAGFRKYLLAKLFQIRYQTQVKGFFVLDSIPDSVCISKLMEHSYHRIGVYDGEGKASDRTFEAGTVQNMHSEALVKDKIPLLLKGCYRSKCPAVPWDHKRLRIAPLSSRPS